MCIRDRCYAELYAIVQARAQELERRRAPAVAWALDEGCTAERLIEFLAIVASGRTAALGDPDWPDAVREQVRRRIVQQPATMPAPDPLTPFYIGFTSGSTGLPKGFCRHHRSWIESLRVCVDTFGPAAAMRVLAPGRTSHSLFLFGMVQGLWSGAGVRVQQRFSAARSLQTLARDQAACLVAVPSQLLLMLALAARRAMPPIEATRLVLISGARWMRERTPELRRLFPRARIVEFYGASETSFMAWAEADENLPANTVGRPFSNVEIDIRGAAAPGEPGLIFVRSPMVFIDYVGLGAAGEGQGGGHDITAAIRDGDWLSVRDMGHLDGDGLLHLAGRQQRMLVTQGKNLFPEEVESVLSAHPRVDAVSVLGVPDPLRGTAVVAVVQPASGVRFDAQELAAWCRDRLEPYKIPRRFWLCLSWPQTPSGKTDHARLALAVRTAAPAVAGPLLPLLEA